MSHLTGTAIPLRGEWSDTNVLNCLIPFWGKSENKTGTLWGLERKSILEAVEKQPVNLLFRVQLSLRSITISCPLQMLVRGWNSLTAMFLSVIFLFTALCIPSHFLYAVTEFVQATRSWLIPQALLTCQSLGLFSRFLYLGVWKRQSVWLWCPGVHSIFSD